MRHDAGLVKLCTNIMHFQLFSKKKLKFFIPRLWVMVQPASLFFQILLKDNASDNQRQTSGCLDRDLFTNQEVNKY